MEKCTRCGRELAFSPITNDLKCPNCNPEAFFEINEKFVKQNLERMVLSLLEQQPLCGYDIIKIIFQRFNVPVSHGRVYPLLYSLESRGILKSEIRKGARVKVYHITERGVEFIRSRPDEFAEVRKHLGIAGPR